MKKKITFIILIILVCTINYAAEKESKELIKRTVAIMPFINSNNVEKYNYLSGTLMDSLTSELINSDQFNMTAQSGIDTTLARMTIKKEDSASIETAKKIALALKSDVIIIGKFVIINEEILISINVYDVFTQVIVASTNKKGELGVDIFRVIEDSTKDIAQKMKTTLIKVDKSYFTEMNKFMKSQFSLEQSKKFGITNRIGLGLLIPGSIILLGGSGLLIYDLAGYANILRQYRNDYDKTGNNKDQYLNSYNIFIALFSASVCSMGLGLLMLVPGVVLLVLMINPVENKKVTLNVGFTDRINISMAFKF